MPAEIAAPAETAAPAEAAASDAAAQVGPDCAAVSDVLAGDAGAGLVLNDAERHHVSACLRCQAEQAGYRRMMRAMRALSQRSVGAAPRLELEILGRVDWHDRRWARLASSRAAAAMGGLAAGAAAVAGAVAFAARRRTARFA